MCHIKWKYEEHMQENFLHVKNRYMHYFLHLTLKNFSYFLWRLLHVNFGKVQSDTEASIDEQKADLLNTFFSSCWNMSNSPLSSVSPSQHSFWAIQHILFFFAVKKCLG